MQILHWYTYKSTQHFNVNIKAYIFRLICEYIQYLQIRAIDIIKDLVPNSALIPPANSLVTILLNYSISLYRFNLLKIQRFQNATARTITKTPKHDHINHIKSILRNLPWLLV